MPLIQIHMIKGVRTPEEIRQLADVVHATLLEHFAAPERDRYQIITQHEPYEMICEDTNLGITRSDRLVFVQILQQGRSATQKQEFYAALAHGLEEQCGTSGNDLIVAVGGNGRDDWSFGHGKAQFLTGDL